MVRDCVTVPCVPISSVSVMIFRERDYSISVCVFLCFIQYGWLGRECMTAMLERQERVLFKSQSLSFLLTPEIRLGVRVADRQRHDRATPAHSAHRGHVRCPFRQPFFYSVPRAAFYPLRVLAFSEQSHGAGGGGHNARDGAVEDGTGAHGALVEGRETCVR